MKGKSTGKNSKRKTPSLVGKAAAVKWKDAWANGDHFLDSEQVQGMADYFVGSVGWVVTDDEKGISLAGDMNLSRDDYRRVLFVPREMIQEVWVCEWKRVKR